MKENEPGWIAADEDDLRRRLEAIADTTEIADDTWTKIQARIAEANEVETTKAAPSRRPVAIAAAAAVIALVLGVLTVLQREDPQVVDAVDEDETTTTEGGGSTRRTTTTESDTPGTTEEREVDRPGDALDPQDPTADDGSTQPTTCNGLPCPVSPVGGDGSGTPSTPGGGGGTSAPTSSSSSSTSSTTDPPPEVYDLSLSPDTVTNGEVVDVANVTPCTHPEYSIALPISIVYLDIQVAWGFGHWVDQAAGMWEWQYTVAADLQPGTYTVRAQCTVLDPDAPNGGFVIADYERLTFTVTGP